MNENNEFNNDLVERDFDESYTNNSNRTMNIRTYIESYSDNPDSSETETICGRVTRVNDVSSYIFMDIVDESGEVQIIFDGENGEDTRDYDCEQVREITIGDIIEVSGNPRETHSGEFSLYTSSWRMLTPTSRTVPFRTGIDGRERITDRVGSLLVNDGLFDNVETRFDVINETRSWLQSNGFREVDTPILHHTPSGAAATAFETHSSALDDSLYLRVAPELYLKRLVISGFENIFEIGPAFRNEDIDSTHNPEFLSLELYQAYSDYEDMMEITEQLVSDVIAEVNGSTIVEFDGHEIDFSAPWDRVDYFGRLTDTLGSNPLEMSDDELFSVVSENLGVSVETRIEAYEELYDEYIEDELIQPTFVVNHPYESTPLCAQVDDDNRIVARFEAVAGGMEIANSYSELTDPIEQEEAFANQTERDEMTSSDEEFVNDLAYGMPPTGGLGIGLERIAMLAAEEESIRDVLPFPQRNT